MCAGQQVKAVTLMTLHASKGLKFPVVFAVGVEDGLIPYRERDADEERRLLYVGMTRAEDELVLSWVRKRLRYGQPIEPERSPLIDAIPEGLIEFEHPEMSRRRTGWDQMDLF